MHDMTSSQDQKVIECRLTAQANNLKLLRWIVKDSIEFIGVEPELVKNMVLAINEACMNIIQHAYQNQQDGEIHLTIFQDMCGLVFVIKDDAPCIDPMSVISRDLDDIRPGGLGVHFIRKIMDEVSYESCLQKGNKLILRKYLS